jgi:hypothetical protein
MRAQSEEWPEIFHGPPSLASMVQVRLSAEGIRTFIPDAHLRVLDPFSTGGDVFALRVLVDHSQLARAREILEGDALEIPAGDVVDPKRREVERIGERIVNGAALFYLAPLALVHAFKYFPRARRLPTRPRRHGLVVAATWLALLQVVVVGVLLGLWITTE